MNLSLISLLSRHAERQRVKIYFLARFLTEVLVDGILINSISDSSIIVSSNSDVSESDSFKIFNKIKIIYIYK